MANVTCCGGEPAGRIRAGRRSAAVDGDPPFRAGRHPGAHGRPARSRRRGRETAARSCGRASDAAGRSCRARRRATPRSERRPQRPAVGADRDMPRRAGHPCPPQHLRALGVHDDDLLAGRVRHVRERPPRMDGRVPRRLEAFELRANPARTPRRAASGRRAPCARRRRSSRAPTRCSAAPAPCGCGGQRATSRGRARRRGSRDPR